MNEKKACRQLRCMCPLCLVSEQQDFVVEDANRELLNKEDLTSSLPNEKSA